MANLSGITQALFNIHPYSTPQLEVFTNMLTHKEVKKKECLLEPGQICEGITFINSGSLRCYNGTEEQEKTIAFYTENNWVADLESLLNQQPSNNYIVAFETTQIAYISLENIHLLMDMHPAFKMLNAMLAHLAVPTAHFVTMNMKTPDERYRELLSSHPDWINHFPQNAYCLIFGNNTGNIK